MMTESQTKLSPMRTLHPPGRTKMMFFYSLKETRSEDLGIDDRQSSGGRDTIVPEVFDNENDDMIVENESPRGRKYNLRPNPTPNFTDEYRYYSDT